MLVIIEGPRGRAKDIQQKNNQKPIKNIGSTKSASNDLVPTQPSHISPSCT